MMLNALAAILHRWPRLRPFASITYRLCGRIGESSNSIRQGRLRTGSRILLNLREWGPRHIFMYGSYEEPTTALLTKLAQKGWRFLDVGSNHGYYALLARDLGGSTARIVAFEPNPTVMRLLRRSVDLNGFENVEAVEAACSNESGFLNLYLSSDPHNSGTSTLSRELRAKGGLVRVRVITIDEYCAGGEFTPDVVKLDVEGHELHVLEGMRRILQDEPPRAIIAELTDDPRLRAHQGVPKFLAQFGYCPTVPNDDGSLRKLREIHEIQNVCYVLRGDPLLRAANIADE